MSTFTAVPSRMRSALFALLLTFAPALAFAQGTTGPGRVATVVVAVPSVRVRTAPSISSLSIDEYREGSVFAVADDDYQSKDWMGIILDGRVAFVPRLAVAPRSRQTAPAPAALADPEQRTVMQAGAPVPMTAPAAAPTAAPVYAPAPARVAAARPTPVTIAAALPAPAVVAAAPTPTQRPAPAPQPAPAQRVALAGPARTAAPAAAPAPAPVPTAAIAAAPTPAAPAPPAPAEKKADQPQFSARRAGLDVTVGILGSVTPIKTNGLTPTAHIAGVTFLGARYRRIGLYFAPEYGQGGGYRSTMMGGGLSLDLISLDMLHVTALGGYMKYSQVAMPDSTILVPQTDRSLQGPSVGGMVSIPFLGPMRLAYRGQYVMAQDAGVQVKMIRHSLGLVF